MNPSKAARRLFSLLRKMPGKVQLARTAGLGIALAEAATKGSKTYKGTNPTRLS